MWFDGIFFQNEETFTRKVSERPESAAEDSVQAGSIPGVAPNSFVHRVSADSIRLDARFMALGDQRSGGDLPTDRQGEGGHITDLLAAEVETPKLQHQQEGRLALLIAVVDIEPTVTIPNGEIRAARGRALATSG